MPSRAERGLVTQRWTTRCGAVVLAFVCAVAFLIDVALMSAMTNLLHMNDFGKFYYSARAFSEGTDMYAPSPATDLRFKEAPELQFLNMNPPHFHLIVMPLAKLTPQFAVIMWIGLSVLGLVMSVLVIGREVRLAWTPMRMLAAAAAILAFAGTQSFFATGQLSLVLLLAVTLAWVAARQGRWTLCSVILGVCLSVKPFLLVFLPYFLLTRRYRVAIASIAAAALSFAVGFAIFGVDAYRSWYGALAQSGDWAWGFMNASVLGFLRRTFDTQPIVTPLVIAPAIVRGWIVAAAVIGIITVITAVRDRPNRSVDHAFALLLVAAQLMSPLGWIYYLWLPAGPIAAVALTHTADHTRSRVRTGLAVVAAIGFFWPMPLLTAFQPHAWATLSIASIYFWATLALWMWLMTDVSGA